MPSRLERAAAIVVGGRKDGDIRPKGLGFGKTDCLFEVLPAPASLASPSSPSSVSAPFPSLRHTAREQARQTCDLSISNLPFEASSFCPFSRDTRELRCALVQERWCSVLFLVTRPTVCGSNADQLGLARRLRPGPSNINARLILMVRRMVEGRGRVQRFESKVDTHSSSSCSFPPTASKITRRNVSASILFISCHDITC
jgi:hypothetical protein